MLEAEELAPAVAVEFSGSCERDDWSFDEDVAEIPLLGGSWLEAERDPARARVRTTLDPSHLTHSVLVAVGAVFGRWAGRDSFHAGVFAVDGRAWALLGDRGAGKTSTLARLALMGHDVLSDDMLLTDGASAFAGARAIDLRPDAAHRLGIEDRTTPARGTQRLRLALPAVRAAYPLAGWIVLRPPGTQPSLDRLPVVERVPALGEQVMLSLLPARAETFVALAALPAYQVSRDDTWSSEDRLVEEILSAVAA